MKHFLHLLLCLLLYYSGVAQPYYFRHYQVENGLSNNSVFCTIEDKSGFMWFGTKDGLNRFDGYHFKHFSTNDEGHNLTPDIVSCLLVDNNDQLLVGCQKGLYTFNREKESLTRLFDSLVWINGMSLDRNGQLWFISAITLCHYDFKTKQIRTYPPSQYFAATSICTADNGDLWVATTDGFIEHFDEQTGSFTPYNVFANSPVPASYWIQKIYAAGNNALFVGTSNQGLKKFDIATSTYKDVLSFNPDKTTIFIRDIKKNAENEYWFATESGIFILDNLTGKFVHLQKKFPDPYSLSDNAVYSLFKDHEGGIWVGTFFGGINYYSSQYSTFQKYFPDNSKSSISGSAVREICEDQLGDLWIGTEDAGLNKLNPKTGVFTQFRPSGEKTTIAYTNIHGLLADGNNLWIGTFEHGLDVMDIHTGKVIRHYSAGPGKYDLHSNFIVSLLKTGDGTIYAGSGNSLFKYSKEKDGFERVAETPEHIFVACLLEDHNKNIWVGTHGRSVYYFNPVTKKTGSFQTDPKNENSLTNDIINAIFEDSKYNIWVSTDGGGICKIDSSHQKISSFTTKNGLPSNSVFKALEDNNGKLWITTSRGLVRLNPNNNAVNIYTKDNGLLSDQFNYNSGYKDADGKMYFGSVKGLISFKPGDLLKTVVLPKVYITGLQVQNRELEIDRDTNILKKSIVLTDRIVLEYDQSSFSIDFAATSYTSPEVTKYAYKLLGIDKDWTYLKSNRKVYFTNLAPGTYVFKVKAGNNVGWSVGERSLTIVVLPPFWATWWAYFIYILLGSLLLFFLVTTYHNRLMNKKEKEIYEAKIEFFTNLAHEIKTPLTLIKGPVENLSEIMETVPEIKEDVSMMERNTSRLINLVNQILDFRQTETKGFSLDFTSVNLTEILLETYTTFEPVAKKKKITYNITLPETTVMMMADGEALIKIFSNLFSNAVKYSEKEVYIALLLPGKKEEDLMIEISNDGLLIPDEMKEKIFEPFVRLRETARQKGTGLGLALARSLVDLHDGNLFVRDSQTGMNTFVVRFPHELLVEPKKSQGLANLIH